MFQVAVLARRIVRFALVLLLAACGDDGEPGGPPLPAPGNPPALDLRLQQVGTAFSFPLFATAPPGDNTRLFVVEKNGVVKIINLATQQTLSTPFLNLTSEIDSVGERGMLGLTFHPNYSVNGFFYVYLINTSLDTEIRRYTVSADPNVADPLSKLPIISVDQPSASNHKAGWLGFGQDGFLYAALGDGGSNSGTGQDLNTLLGKILRLDVDADDFPGDASKNYAIPPGNPFAGPIAGLDEIWSFGLRNPFRVSFDRLTGDFYIADVGQSRREEVNVSTVAGGGGSGTNYGWNTMEGSLCFNPMMGCSTGGLALPVVEYDHTQGCSITGGYVYRGAALPALQGTYFYGDFCQGFVRSFRLANGVATEQTDWTPLRPGGNITSFGEDAAGELYLVTSGGGLFRIVR